MENPKQNKLIENIAYLTLKTGVGEWRATPISETPWAIATDPIRVEGRLADGWWERAESGTDT